jgi:hypothetical protein
MSIWMSSVLSDGWKIGLFKVGMLVQYLFLSHAGSEPSQHIPNGNAESADAGLAAAFTRLNGNPWRSQPACTPRFPYGILSPRPS